MPTLCDVGRYHNTDYHNDVPVITYADVVESPTSATISAASTASLVYVSPPGHEAAAQPQIAQRFFNASCNLDEEHHHRHHHHQDVVENNNNNTNKMYPAYGGRDAAKCLADVRDIIFSKWGADLCLPVATPFPNNNNNHSKKNDEDDHAHQPLVMESREQYWRRLARHYIQHGFQCAGQALPTANVGQLATAEPEDPFYIIDLGRVVEQFCRWRERLPMVRPFFAVKCSPTLSIMEVLSALGAGFDCASKAEMELIHAHHLVENMADDIIFANPCKQPGDVRAAQSFGVRMMTFDNVAELEKMAELYPDAQAVLRIKTDDHAAVCAFSTKFGASMDDVPILLHHAQRLGVEVIGVSFHVGSGNGDTSAYVGSLMNAHKVFGMAEAYGFHCTLLDIGGGYPGDGRRGGAPTKKNNNDDDDDDDVVEELLSFESIAAAMRPVLEELFSAPDVRIISEPGRYFTAATHALCMNVFARRQVKWGGMAKQLILDGEAQKQMRDDDGDDHDDGHHDVMEVLEHEEMEYQYYVNDGLYHSFNCILYDHAHPRLLVLDDGDGIEADAHNLATKLHLLRDVGCQFLSPPSVLALTELKHRNNNNDGTSATSSLMASGLRSRAVALDGATLSLRFAVPTTLPTRLPRDDLGQRLRDFYAHQRRCASGEHVPVAHTSEAPRF